MTASPWQFTDTARSKIATAVFDLDSDSFKMALVTSASNIAVTATAWAAVTGEVANGNGYTTGGEAITITLSGTVPLKISFADVSWTPAVGQSFACRTAVIYEVGGDVLAFSVLDATPADVVVTNSAPLTIGSDVTNGMAQWG